MIVKQIGSKHVKLLYTQKLIKGITFFSSVQKALEKTDIRQSFHAPKNKPNNNKKKEARFQFKKKEKQKALENETATKNAKQ